MRKQIGWYNPGSGRFCYSDVKEANHATYTAYTVPAFTCAGDDRIITRVLENQLAILLALRDRYTDQTEPLTTACQCTEECIEEL